MADKPYSELTATERAKFGSEEEYKNFMKSTRDTTGLAPMPSSDEMDRRAGLVPMPSFTPQPTQTLTDPSEFIQAQVGARVNQPFLPQGTAVTPGLALQTPTTATMQTTPGLTGDTVIFGSLNRKSFKKLMAQRPPNGWLPLIHPPEPEKEEEEVPEDA